MSIVRAGAVQFQHRPGDKGYNRSRVEFFTRQAREQGIQILVFPECCLSGYWHLRKLSDAELEALAEPIPEGECTQFLIRLAQENQLTLGAGLVEQGSDGRLYNSYVVALPDGQIHVHRKLHAFIHPHIASGDRYTVFDTPHGCRVGILICYDNNLVENARSTALLGADVLLAPHQTGGCDSGSPFAMGRIDPQLWQRREEDPHAIEAEFRGPKGREWLLRWLPSRAHDNGIFLVFSNGVGQDDDEVRTGNSMILDPYGRILSETCEAADALVTADLDLTLRARSTGARWVRARRPELYGMLTERRGDEENTRKIRFEHLEKSAEDA